MENFDILYPVPLPAITPPTFVVVRKLFTPRQCQQLLSFSQTHRRFYQSGNLRDTRYVQIFYLSPSDLEWPFAKIGRAVSSRNVWKFALSGFAHPMRIQRYTKGGFTNEHADFEYELPDPSKITAVVPLVPKENWKGGQIRIGNHALSPKIDLGDCLLFPSFYAHEVTAVTHGTRVVLTAWISGPSFV